jgi:parvulin-like peptidyl-prolyl isomerase
MEEIVAKVNGDIVTRGDLADARIEAQEQFAHQGLKGIQLEQAMSEIEKNALRNKIDQLLMVQKGKELDIKVDSDVSKYLADLQKQLGEPDPDKFHDKIRQETGMTFEDFKADVTNNMLTERVVRQEVMSKMPIDHKDVEAYYNAHKDEFVRQEQVFLREILVSTEGRDAAGLAAAQKKANDLVRRARGGERFADLAHENSDAVTAKDFGDLGGWKKGELQPSMEKAVWNQPSGYVTDPIRIEKGFEILKVDDHTKAGLAPLDEVEPQITEKILNPRAQPAVREFLTRLRESAFLEIKPGFVDTGAATGKLTAWVDTAQLRPETVKKADVMVRTRKKRLLGMPVPGTAIIGPGTSSSTTSSSLR